jgi:hypothetical protein
MKVLLKVVIGEDDQIEIHSGFDSNLATLGFLEVIKSVLVERSGFIQEEDGTLEEDSIAYPIINTNTQA